MQVHTTLTFIALALVLICTSMSLTLIVCFPSTASLELCLQAAAGAWVANS